MPMMTRNEFIKKIQFKEIQLSHSYRYLYRSHFFLLCMTLWRIERLSLSLLGTFLKRSCLQRLHGSLARKIHQLWDRPHDSWVGDVHKHTEQQFLTVGNWKFRKNFRLHKIVSFKAETFGCSETKRREERHRRVRFFGSWVTRFPFYG